MAISIIGYSQADFKTLITAKKLYIDRTAFIEATSITHKVLKTAYVVGLRPD
jgi:hypothetical protein